MPSRPNTPCRHPGCPELVPSGTKYCDKHNLGAKGIWQVDTGGANKGRQVGCVIRSVSASLISSLIWDCKGDKTFMSELDAAVARNREARVLKLKTRMFA